MVRKLVVALALSLLCTSPGGAEQKAVSQNTTIVLETSLGRIKAVLYPDAAPVSVKNFLEYVNSGFYNGTIFHRVIPGFVIQGGGFTTELHLKSPHAPIKNEAANGLKNDRGTLSMARTGDPNSATSQFFINLADNSGLNRPQPDGYGYAVFGKVIEGMDTVDKIAAVKTSYQKGFQDVPVTPIIIKSVQIVK